MRVAIIDSGIDLRKLYSGDRHGYDAVWINVEGIEFSAIHDCEVVIVPAGSDSSLLYPRRDCLASFVRRGGWLLCFDGPAIGIFDELSWLHTRTDYKSQTFRVPETNYSHLLEGVPLEGLECKEGVRGWWCEGELQSERHVPLLVDNAGRVIASVLPNQHRSGGIIATAVGRLPIFSQNPSRASNLFFSNLLSFCGSTFETARSTQSDTHLYVHSGNWAHRAFLRSDRFGHQFEGVHWSCLDSEILRRAVSIWLPWESNIRGLKHVWPELEAAVVEGATLVIEDLRDSWLPGIIWEQRPVDSSWWREGRPLDLVIRSQARSMFPNLDDRAFAWHYHGVFDGPADATPVLVTADQKNVLTYSAPSAFRRGSILASTLDATFEYGVGKIPETADYIDGVLEFVTALAHANRDGLETD